MVTSYLKERIKVLIEVEDRIREIEAQIQMLEREKKELIARFEFLLAEIRKIVKEHEG